MELIGISGYARSGKDTAAEVLVKEFGFQRIAFADKLRDFLYALNPLVDVDVWTEELMVEDLNDPVQTNVDIIPIRLREVIDQIGWDGYKSTGYSDEIRGLLQRLGTEAGRETLWDSIWVDAAFVNLDPNGKYVVTDMRFPNEMEAIQHRDGWTWRIVRPGVGPANNHPSETSLDLARFDEYLFNDSTIIDFHEQVKKLYLEEA